MKLEMRLGSLIRLSEVGNLLETKVKGSAVEGRGQ